jgi:hypothetical protein
MSRDYASPERCNVFGCGEPLRPQDVEICPYHAVLDAESHLEAVLSDVDPYDRVPQSQLDKIPAVAAAQERITRAEREATYWRRSC